MLLPTLFLSIMLTASAVIFAKLIWRHWKNRRTLYEVKTRHGSYLVGPLRYSRMQKAGLVDSVKVIP